LGRTCRPAGPSFFSSSFLSLILLSFLLHSVCMHVTGHPFHTCAARCDAVRARPGYRSIHPPGPEPEPPSRSAPGTGAGAGAGGRNDASPARAGP
jgi:hypothetical protein